MAAWEGRPTDTCNERDELGGGAPLSQKKRMHRQDGSGPQRRKVGTRLPHMAAWEGRPTDTSNERDELVPVRKCVAGSVFAIESDWPAAEVWPFERAAWVTTADSYGTSATAHTVGAEWWPGVEKELIRIWQIRRAKPPIFVCGCVRPRTPERPGR